MSGTVIAHPRPGHSCNPGWSVGITTQDSDLFPAGSRYSIPPSQYTHPAGTVWQCDECGRTWVSRPPRWENAPGDVSWRREHWWERRRRLRRTTPPATPVQEA